jgi:hypothetical protein
VRAVVRRFSVLSCLTVFGVIGGIVTVARANDSDLRCTFTKDVPNVIKDEQTLKHALPKYARGRAKPLERALNREIADLDRLRSQLKRESASSARGAKAKSLIINGLGLIASAYTRFHKDVRAGHDGPVPAAEVKVALKVRTQGRAELLAGAKLLALTASAAAPASALKPICNAACVQRLLKAMSGTQSLAGTPPQLITKAASSGGMNTPLR